MSRRRAKNAEYALGSRRRRSSPSRLAGLQWSSSARLPTSWSVRPRLLRRRRPRATGTPPPRPTAWRDGSAECQSAGSQPEHEHLRVLGGRFAARIEHGRHREPGRLGQRPEAVLGVPVQHPRPLEHLAAALVAADRRVEAGHLVTLLRHRREADRVAAVVDRLAGPAELARRRRLRDEERHERRSARLEVRSHAIESAGGQVVVGQEVEGRPGEEDRAVPAAEVHRLHRRLVQHHLDARLGGGLPREGEHVGRRVEALHVEAATAQLDQRLAVAAPELERRLTARRDERGVGIRVGDRRAQRRVELGDEPCVERGRAGSSLSGQRPRGARRSARR